MDRMDRQLGRNIGMYARHGHVRASGRSNLFVSVPLTEEKHQKKPQSNQEVMFSDLYSRVAQFES
jgi:hypothetical protein